MPDLLTTLVGYFVRDTPQKLKILKEAVRMGKAADLEMPAHSLKGSCGNLGARRMAQLCAELEEISHAGDLGIAGKLLEQLEAEYERAKVALQAEIGKN